MKDLKWHIKPNKEKSLMLAKRQLTELVYDAVNLEGLNFTLPEIQTLLDGITVGGHKISDQQIVLNQAIAWKTLFEWISTGKFDLTSQKICELHKIAAKEEALSWGRFRSGGVTIAGTTYIPPKACMLSDLFDDMIHQVSEIIDVYDKAIFIFLMMARYQFFYDVNKRMGRFMMNGLLLNAGFPAINLPANRQLEFNQLMLSFYDSFNQEPMNQFLRSCLDKRAIKIMKEN